MNEDFLYRNATFNDIPFLVETIVESEKSGTNNYGMAKLFGLNEGEMKKYLAAALEEEVDGCELSVSSFIVADYQGKTAAAFAGWVEGVNEDEQPSSILKSNLVSFVFPHECILKSALYSDILADFQIERPYGTYQLEYAYTLSEYRGKGIMRNIIEKHIERYIASFAKPSIIQVEVTENNNSAIKTYESCGFKIVGRYVSDNELVENYFPCNAKLLMEKHL